MRVGLFQAEILSFYHILLIFSSFFFFFLNKEYTLLVRACKLPLRGSKCHYAAGSHADLAEFKGLDPVTDSGEQDQPLEGSGSAWLLHLAAQLACEMQEL